MSVTSEQGQSLSPIKRALLAIENMQAKLDALEYAKREPIAIIGMGCRYPGASNPVAFWQLLSHGVDAIAPVPKDRWDVESYYDPDPDAPGKIYVREGGFLSGVDTFNPQFFGISAREAKSLDPQQRLLLEVAWEALENANKAPEQLFNSLTGVFIGISSNDYNQMIWEEGGSTEVDAFCATGNALSVAAGRLSYTLGLKGPSLAVDTACSSSLVAVHLACQNLRQGECNLALVGGVNLLLAPESTVAFARTHVLDNRCKTFDATANGYVRGEGCGVLILKRLSDALADGDNILAVIRGSAVNHNGRSSSLVAPNGPSQQTLIRKALENAGVEPLQVNYVEVQGTSTSLGQPIEVEALAAVLGKNRPQNQPLIIGSVKTNIGHTEAASGIASLIKVILAFQHGEIPPHLHFKQPNPYINWNELPVKVPTEPIPWAAGEKPRLAGVSAFGFSGTNAHVVLEEPPSGRGVGNREWGVGEIGENLSSPFPTPDSPLPTPDSPLPTPHSPLPTLLALSAKTEESLKHLAQQYEKHLGANPDLSVADVCFTANTGRSHFQHRLCMKVSSLTELRDKLAAFSAGEDVVGLFKGKATNHAIAFVFAGVGVEYVGMGRQLYETQSIFRSSFDRCDEILRRYVGEGLLEVLTADEQGSALVRQSGLGGFPHEELPKGFPGLKQLPRRCTQMEFVSAALFAVEYALFELWRSWGVEPAMVMGDGVGEYVAACVAGVFSLEDGLKLIAKPDEGITKEVIYSQPHIPLVSGMTGELAMTEVASAGYWSGLRSSQPTKFAAGMETLRQQGCDVFLEVGPKPVLWETQVEFVCLASLNPGQEDWQQILESLATLYVSGVKVDWLAFDRDSSRRRVQLPTYPWQRDRYWIETSEHSLKKVEGEISQNHRQTAISNFLNQGDTEKLAQHLQAAGKLSPEELHSLPKILELLVNQHQQQIQGTSPVDIQTEPPKEPLNTDPLTPADIQAWLVRQVAKELGVKPEELDIKAPFDSYGLDSMLAISIASAGHQFLGFEVSPLLLLHYPTIELLSQHLAKEFEASGSEIFEI